jgi:hypothetical protein
MDIASLGFGLPNDRPFTNRQAHDAGVSPKRLGELVRIGLLRRPLRSVYVASIARDTLELRVAAVELVRPVDSFATDFTAAWLFAGDAALPPGADLAPPLPTFFRPSDAGPIRRTGCRSGERAVLPEDLVQLGGVPTTTPLRTAWDLGRLQTPDVALWGMDLMMKVGGFDLAELLVGIERFRGERGVIQLRDLAPWVDAGSESFGESAVRRRWKMAELPKPETQIELWEDGRLIAKLDMGLPEKLFGSEYDGEEWHPDEVAERDASRRAWASDQRGYALEVFRHPHVFGLHQNADFRLRAGFENAVRLLPTKRHFIFLNRREQRGH